MAKMTTEEFQAKRDKQRKKRQAENLAKIKKDKKKEKKLIEKIADNETDVEIVTQKREALEVAKGVSLMPTVQEIEKALVENSGLISFTARKLSISIEDLKKQIKKSKFLKELLFEIRESVIDEAEDSLMQRIRNKQDLIASMFLLKSIGKHRGWIEKPDKAGDSAKKPIFIRILPVGMEANPKGGRPKKIMTMVKEIPRESQKSLKEAAESIVDAEILD